MVDSSDSSMTIEEWHQTTPQISVLTIDKSILNRYNWMHVNEREEMATLVNVSIRGGCK